MNKYDKVSAQLNELDAIWRKSREEILISNGIDTLEQNWHKYVEISSQIKIIEILLEEVRAETLKCRHENCKFICDSLKNAAAELAGLLIFLR